MAFFFNQIHPVFSTRQGLREVTGLPVLGAVSSLQTQAQASVQWRQSAFFGGAFLLLIAAFVCTTVFVEPGVQLAQQLLNADWL